MRKKTLYANDLVIGAKYVPHTKTTSAYSELSKSVVWERARKKNQPYIYYVGVDKGWNNEKVYVFNDTDNNVDGDFFCPSDVTPYRANIFKRIYHNIARVFYTMCRMEAEQKYVNYEDQQAAIEYFEEKIKQHTI